MTNKAPSIPRSFTPIFTAAGERAFAVEALHLHAKQRGYHSMDAVSRAHIDAAIATFVARRCTSDGYMEAVRVIRRVADCWRARQSRLAA